MGCQSEVYLGNNLAFSIATHDPDTGVLTDADAPPLYRVYEDETVVPILTGTMTALDAVNTTGFYTELIACTTANGFESGKSYTIYIEATVDADTGGIAYGFRALTPTAESVWAYATRTLTQSAAAILAAVTGSDVNILRGDTLSASITGLGNISTRTKLWFTVKRERQLTDAQSIIQVEETDGMLYLNGSLVVSLGLTAAAGSITVTDAVAGDITIAISAAAAALLQPQACYYDIQMLTAAGTVTTLTVGKVDVNADVTGAIA